MIVSASYRTDIPAFYAPWFLNRLRAGFAEVRNPYGGPPSRVDLRPDTVNGFVLWTRNLAPLLPHLDTVQAVAPFMVQYTVLGYPTALDRSVVPAERSVEVLHRLAAAHGPRVGVWRYDPIIFSSLTPPAWHIDTFGRLSEALRGAVDEVVVSFAQIYRKTRCNLDSAAAKECFTWNNPRDEDKRALLTALAPLAGANGQRLTLCAQGELLVPGVAEAACIDPHRLSDLAGRALTVAAKPHRKTCRCAQSRDIGAYDTCPHGCAYCYAVQSRDRAKALYQTHDPDAQRLGR
ncbi:MAG: DUF1848 domain-containing protein [Rhodospirillaceae bacterium]